MAKLVALSSGVAGRTHELKVDKTTIGRLEDNTFQLAEPSVSSHHCEILLKGTDVVVRDLNSTNGTFINGEKVSEAVIKPGQILRLGQIELRLDPDGAPSGPIPAPPAGATPAPSPKKGVDQTQVIRGVSLDELERGGKPSGFDTASKAFAKKDNKANKFIIIGCSALALVIIVLLVRVFLMTSGTGR